MEITQKNVGRIAERIVANELEFRGFRVSDLNKEGTSANADLLAVGSKGTFQVQVKGATNTSEDRGWWVQYGFCTQEIIDSKQNRMFNRQMSFYHANAIVLVGVRSPWEYKCVVLPVEIAEKAAQLNLDREYRRLTRKGTDPKPHRVLVSLEWKPRNPSPLLDEELALLSPYIDNWSMNFGIAAKA